MICRLGLHRWSSWVASRPATYKTANDHGEPLVSVFTRSCRRCGATRERIDYTREPA